MKSKAAALSLSLSTCLLASSANADFFALTLEGNVAQTSTDSSQSTPWQGDLALRFKHPFPLVPNIGVGVADRQQGDAADGQRYQAELYYNLLDSLGVYFDIGLGMEWWQAEQALPSHKDSGNQLHAVTRLAWQIPTTRIGLETDLQLPLHDNRFERTQWRAGVRFELLKLLNTTLRAGYQYEEVRAQGRSYEASGGYAGISFKL